MPFPLAALLLLSQTAAPPPPNPQRYEKLTAQVDTAIRERRNLDALGMLDKALKADPKWQQGWWLLGSLLYDMSDYAAARPALERLAGMDPKAGAPWALLGLCDGTQSVEAITRAFRRLYPLVGGVPGERAARFGLQLLVRKRLVTLPKALRRSARAAPSSR